MCKNVNKYKVSKPYLIICDDEADKVVQECLGREWWDRSGGGIVTTMVGGDVDLGCKLEIPLIGCNHLVVLLGVVIAKMPSEVTICCALCVGVMGYTSTLFGLVPLFTISMVRSFLSFAASLLGGGVAIISTIHTGISCRPSAPHLWQSDI